MRINSWLDYRSSRNVAALGLILVGAGCSRPPVSCTTGLPEYAVRVRLFDANTQLQLKGATPGRIADDSYSDSLTVIAVDGEGLASQFGAGRGRAGDYTLYVERDGYLPFTQAGIRVESADCGVIPTEVVAALQPEP
jgi:hypothetical protein